jgi:hypothetical protein
VTVTPPAGTVSIMAFTVRNGVVVEIHALADRDRPARLT